MTTYPTGKVAMLLGVSVRTLQQWDRDGKLKASRSPSGRRLYTDQQIRAYRTELPPRIERLCIAYVRMSSQAQRPDFKNQRKLLEHFCIAKGQVVDEWIEELGGGLNFKRPSSSRFLI